MFLWATLNENIDTSEMLTDAIAENVAYVTGGAFFADGSGTNCMRLNFTHPADDRIVTGVQRLAKVIERWGKERAGSEQNKSEVITGV
jgi:2-aminoadipate transaminase